MTRPRSGEGINDAPATSSLMTTGDIVSSQAILPIGSEPYAGVDPRRTRRLPLRLYIAGGWLTMLFIAAITADWLPLSPRDADACSPACVKVPPFTRWSEILGTDNFGRSILTRVIYGARISLAASIVAVAISITLGLLIGVTAGYFRGKIDAVIGIFLDSILSFPSLILLIALAATMQPGLETVIIGLALISFPSFARLARAGTVKHATSEFVMASRGLGAKRRHVLTRELVPIVFAAMSAYAGVVMAVLILGESSLSFLGLGIPPPEPTWGNMINEGLNYLQTDPHMVFVPAAVLFFTIFSLNLVGDWLRSRSDLTAKI